MHRVQPTRAKRRSPPPGTRVVLALLWGQLPMAQRRHVLVLLSQLVARQLAEAAPRSEEGGDEPDR